MIRFTDSADSILEYPMSRVILIDASLQSKDAVIDRIEKALEAPYNEDNWDGFRDAITDLSWLVCPSVVLVHKALPKMNAWDLKTYLELLYDVSKEWDSGNCEKGFYVYFSLEDKPQIDFYLPGKRLSPQVKEGRRAPAVHIGDVFEILLPDKDLRIFRSGFCRWHIDTWFLTLPYPDTVPIWKNNRQTALLILTPDNSKAWSGFCHFQRSVLMGKKQ